jgi:glyoxylase I family protein
MIIGVHHTAISTPDLERLKTFYCELFGLEEVLRSSWEQGNDRIDSVVGLTGSAARCVFLRGGNTFLELFEYTHPTPKQRDPQWRVCDHGLTHVCFEVTDIYGEFERLVSAGMRFQSDPPPADEHLPLYAAYGFDPDGNIVELIQFPDREKGSETASLSGARLLRDF